ncbi:MAG TPA: hypothetical protein VJ323_02895, partial [Bryobacteraceae bacterium]|nr:hypothetical protein [Bryobacteraceae bacterium]
GGSGAGILTTAGGIVFTADAFGNLLTLDAETGRTLWHAYGGGRVNDSPITFELDGRQYLVIGAGGVLYAWGLPESLLSSAH